MPRPPYDASPRTLAERALRRHPGGYPQRRPRAGDAAAAGEARPVAGDEPDAGARGDPSAGDAGLAEHVQHRGARVSPVTIEDLRDTYEARLALETLAIRHAAERFGPGDAEGARRLIAEHVSAYEAGELRRGREAHAALHLGIYAASGSPWLARLIRPLWENSERYRIASLHARGALDRRRREHERIVRACAAHDPAEAEQSLRAHLVATGNVVARWMGEDDLFPAA